MIKPSPLAPARLASQGLPAFAYFLLALGGPWAFLERRQHYSPLRLFELLAEFLEANPDQRVREVLGDRYEELEELCRWLQVDRFDRRAANRRLAEGMIDRARSPA